MPLLIRGYLREVLWLGGRESALHAKGFWSVLGISSGKNQVGDDMKDLSACYPGGLLLSKQY